MNANAIARRSENRSRRNAAKAEAAAGLADRDATRTAVGSRNATVFRVVVYTQVYENYGTHCCTHDSDAECDCAPYWKAKGGNEYHRASGSAADILGMGTAGLNAIVNDIAATVQVNNRFYREYVIDWEVVPSTQETYQEQMYREMRDEGYFGSDSAVADEVYRERMADMLV